MEKKISFNFVFFSFLLLVSFQSYGQFTTIKYQSTPEDFSNPERGFAVVQDPPDPKKITWNFCDANENPSHYDFTEWTAPFVDSSFKSYRKNNISLVMIRYHLAEFRYKTISPEFISRLNQDFAVIRKEGFKVIPRFAYNWPQGGPDAPLKFVLEHLDTLKQVFEQNADVIAFVEFGFIGCWGEMHNSHYGLIDEETGINEATRKIIAKMFQTVPKSRMVAVRYPAYKLQYFTNSPDIPVNALTEKNAFDGSIQSRWGQHDDCLVCGEFNWGTYGNTKESAQRIYQFLEQDNKYAVQGGEPGGMDNPSDKDMDGDGFSGTQYADCSRTIPLLARLHWSTMNWNYGKRKKGNGISYETWEKQGCYNEISKRLGYRFQLVEAKVPKQSTAGKLLTFELRMRNTGFANLYNARHIEIVLKSTNGLIRRLRYQTSTDERLWFPQSGTEKSLAISINLPADLAAGAYTIFLNFPDPAPSLNNRPEYAIRLANVGIWDGVTGYNSLEGKIIIKK